MILLVKLFYLNHQTSAIYLKPALTMGNTLQCLAQKKKLQAETYPYIAIKIQIAHKHSQIQQI